MPTTTIGFVPRDQFSKGAAALRQIFERTSLPCHLVTVNPQMPERYWRDLNAVLGGRDNVTVLQAAPFTSTNEAKNMAARASDSEYLCLIENDVFVEEGWLERLLAACEEMPADVAVPLIYERDRESQLVHFDDRLGSIQTVQTENGPGIRILPRLDARESDLQSTRRKVQMIETHCVLFRRSAFDRIGGLDAGLSTSRNEVDLSLALHHAGATVAFEPASHVTFLPPPPVELEERDFYLERWDPARARQDQDRIERRWNVIGFPNSVGFAEYRYQLAKVDPGVQETRFAEFEVRLRRATDEIASAVPPGRTFILVDDVQWKANVVGKGRRPLPFLEREGQFYGPPSDDATAISELERMRGMGAEYMVFGWPAFWWLEYYRGFEAYIRENFRSVLDNDRLIVFDLRRSGAAS